MRRCPARLPPAAHERNTTMYSSGGRALGELASRETQAHVQVGELPTVAGVEPRPARSGQGQAGQRAGTPPTPGFPWGQALSVRSTPPGASQSVRSRNMICGDPPCPARGHNPRVAPAWLLRPHQRQRGCQASSTGPGRVTAAPGCRAAKGNLLPLSKSKWGSGFRSRNFFKIQP